MRQLDQDSTKSTIRIGFFIIFLIFGVGGIWASIAPLSQGAVAVGKVVVENKRKTVQHLEGGIVEQINVKEGQPVTAGDVLVQLDNTHAKTNAQTIAKQLYFLQAEEARLHAEIDLSDSILFPETKFMDANEHEILAIKQNQQALFEARKQAIEGELDILSQKAGQLDKLIQGLVAQKNAKLTQIALLREEVNDNELLYNRKSISKIRLLELKRLLAEGEGELGSLISEIASTELQKGETNLKKLQLAKEFNEKALNEVRQIQTSLADNLEKMTQANAVLERTLIRAPVSGIVVNNQVVTVGEIVNSGDTLMEIVPTDQRLIIEARVQTQDIDVVRQGLKAEIRLLPFKQRLLPIVLGTITDVSADILEDERTGENFYLAKVEIGNDEMTKLGEHSLVPGMPADIIVQAGEYTMLEYLMAPLTDNFARALKE